MGEEDVCRWSAVTKFHNVLAEPQYPWQWWELSMNPNVTERILLDNPQLPWDFEAVSNNPNVTLRVVDAYPEQSWDYTLLGCSINSLTLQDIDERRNNPWSIGLSDFISTSDVVRRPDLPWNWHRVSRSRRLDIFEVAQNSHLPWDWDEINFNAVIRANDVLKYPRLPWNYSYLAYNIGIDAEWALAQEKLLGG